MNITRALAEIKLLDSRINSSNGMYVNMKKGQQVTVDGMTVSDYEKMLVANLQSVSDLIKRRHLIKRAVVLSNATTMVNVGGVEMTVAEAIDLKNTIKLDKQLLSALKNQYITRTNEVNNQNQRVAISAEQEATANFGAKQKSDSTEFNKFVEDYKARNEYSIIDPNNARLKIVEMEERISSFETEVDYILSESNALTQINI